MDEYQQLISIIAMTMGVAWASGINLYATIVVLGLAGATGNIALPEGLQVVQDPMVIGAAALMYGVEFFADKTPGVDTGWDAIHTFIRIPAGAMLAASAVGDVTPALQVSAGILGGSLTGITHAGKTGSRVLINTSPEPFSNWLASFSEDILVIVGLWTALNHPVIFLALLAVFIVLLLWLLPKLWRGIKLLASKLRSWLGYSPKPSSNDYDDCLDQLSRLKQLLDDGVITQQEFDEKKQQILYS
jgi:hypothetical protein